MKQAHPQTFGLEAASAIVGLFGAQVAFDACGVECAHVHGERHAVDLAVSRLAIEQGQAGQKGYAGAA
ncbi:hypothetical protein D3C84_890070 [compost metagenome]